MPFDQRLGARELTAAFSQAIAIVYKIKESQKIDSESCSLIHLIPVLIWSESAYPGSRVVGEVGASQTGSESRRQTGSHVVVSGQGPRFSRVKALLALVQIAAGPESSAAAGVEFIGGAIATTEARRVPSRPSAAPIFHTGSHLETKH